MKRIAVTAAVILGVMVGTTQAAQAAVLHGPYSTYTACELARSGYPTADHPCYQRTDKFGVKAWWFATP